MENAVPCSSMVSLLPPPTLLEPRADHCLLFTVRAWWILEVKPMKVQRPHFGIIKYKHFALAGVAQWIEHQPVNQRVTSSIPSQGTCLGCGPGPQ